MIGLAAKITEVASGIYRLSLLPGDHLNAYAIVAGGSVTLVDCGLPFVSAPPLLACLDTLGLRRSAVNGVVATHAHLDHVGGLARVQRSVSATTVAHLDDVPYLRSGKTPSFDRSTRAGRYANRLLAFGFPRAEVHYPLSHGQTLHGSGLEVIHTPGHTPGHMCLLHRETGVLILGDALYHFRGRLTWPSYATCWNFALAQASARTLPQFEFSVACFGHGPEMTIEPRAAISEFVDAGS